MEVPWGVAKQHLIDMLSVLPAKYATDRDAWRDVTFSLRWLANDGVMEHDARVQLYHIWNDWSKEIGGEHFDQDENDKLWFTDDRTDGKVKTIASLVALAKQHGWTRGARAMDKIAQAVEDGVVEVQAVTTATTARVDRRADAQAILEEALHRYVFNTASGTTWLDLRQPETLMTKAAQISSKGLSRLLRQEAQRDADGNVLTVFQVMFGSPDLMTTSVASRGDPGALFGFQSVTDSGDARVGWVNMIDWPQIHPEVPDATLARAQELWHEVLSQIFPVEAERLWAERWLAHKLLHPRERMVALVSVAPRSGTGRSTFMELMKRVYGVDNCDEINIERMVGDDGKWNDFLLYPMVFLSEVDTDGGHEAVSFTVKQRRKVYERLKTICDPRQSSKMRINTKSSAERRADVFTSFFLASNRADALPISDDDRRFCVLSGNTEEGGAAYYRKVVELQTPEMLAALRIHLAHEVDLSTFTGNVPMETTAKQIMREETRTEFDDGVEFLLREVLGDPPIVTADLIHEACKRYMDGYDPKVDKTKVNAWFKEQCRIFGKDAAGRRVRFTVGTKEVQARVRTPRWVSRGRIADDMSVTELREAIEAFAKDAHVSVVEKKAGRAIRKWWLANGAR